MVLGLFEGLRTGKKAQMQGDEEDVIRNAAAASAYAGGAGTMSSGPSVRYKSLTGRAPISDSVHGPALLFRHDHIP